ncbi:hypothetical protein [Butyricicoccus pullicaecorum]|uniref:hypothetical protein n=1 Tax=Butyricicoccus pullicaecorum TaxID=501571 RepID=UPI001178BA5F|nr:hypothetical protein [Butyricicoccus pullicaecorum]
MNRPNIPRRAPLVKERCFSHVKEEIPPEGEIEAFASLSRKAAGSQGSALSRAPQSAESPFDFPVSRKGKSTKI